MATHVKVIASLYFAISLLFLIGAVFSQLFIALGVGLLSGSHEEGAQTGATVLGIAGVFLSIMLVGFAIPFIVAGWGLLKFKPWARILGIILAVLCLIHIPFGTIVGIYALVILFQKEAEALFVA
ncbi:MAG TPA: hypothetical protein VFV78_08395 [Vicinamibacterales bacterium]|nr:hypothetical protein [Vicinamibacterales bacterium]